MRAMPVEPRMTEYSVEVRALMPLPDGIDDAGELLSRITDALTLDDRALGAEGAGYDYTRLLVSAVFTVLASSSTDATAIATHAFARALEHARVDARMHSVSVAYGGDPEELS